MGIYLENSRPALLSAPKTLHVQTEVQTVTGVATDYLPNYLGWRRMIERLNNRPSSLDVLRASTGLSEAQQVTVT